MRSGGLSRKALSSRLSSRETCRRSVGCPQLRARGRCRRGWSVQCGQTGVCCTAAGRDTGGTEMNTRCETSRGRPVFCESCFTRVWTHVVWISLDLHEGWVLQHPQLRGGDSPVLPHWHCSSSWCWRRCQGLITWILDIPNYLQNNNWFISLPLPREEVRHLMNGF